VPQAPQPQPQPVPQAPQPQAPQPQPQPVPQVPNTCGLGCIGEPNGASCAFPCPI
jgi:hypothetical protein